MNKKEFVLRRGKKIVGYIDAYDTMWFFPWLLLTFMSGGHNIHRMYRHFVDLIDESGNVRRIYEKECRIE